MQKLTLSKVKLWVDYTQFLREKPSLKFFGTLHKICINHFKRERLSFFRWRKLSRGLSPAIWNAPRRPVSRCWWWLWISWISWILWIVWILRWNDHCNGDKYGCYAKCFGLYMGSCRWEQQFYRKERNARRNTAKRWRMKRASSASDQINTFSKTVFL